MDDFTGKVVLITGASSGIGAGAAVDFARCGAKLALTGRDKSCLQTVKHRCIAEGANDEEVICIPGDLTIDDDITHIIDETISHFSTIHILVNNAGAVSVLNIRDTTPDVFDEMYHINLRQVFMMTRGVMDKIIDNKARYRCRRERIQCRRLESDRSRGSLWCDEGWPTSFHAMSGARLGMFDTPIFTRTGGVLEGNVSQKDEFFAAAAKAHPLGRIGDVQEATRAIRFLASEAAAFTTGAIFPVDGGRSGCGPMTPIVRDKNA